MKLNKEKLVKIFKRTLLWVTYVSDALFLLAIWTVFGVTIASLLIKMEIVSLNNIHNEAIKIVLTDTVFINKLGFAVLGYSLGVILSDISQKYKNKKQGENG